MHIPNPIEVFKLGKKGQGLARAILKEVVGAITSKDKRCNKFYRGMGVTIKGKCFEEFLELSEDEQEGVIAHITTKLRLQGWIVGISWQNEGVVHMHIQLKIL